MKRHQTRIYNVVGKGLKPERQDISLIEKVDEWTERFPCWMQRNRLEEGWIINGDESRIKLDRLDFKVKALFARTGIQEYVKNKCAMYLPFVAANGARIMDVFVLPMLNEFFDGEINMFLASLDKHIQFILCFQRPGTFLIHTGCL
jgi:hypothetical protein